MKPIHLLLTALLLVFAGPVVVHACALGLSFHLEALPEHYGREDNLLKPFLDRTFSKRGWEWAKRPLNLVAPAHPENSARIAVQIGSVSSDLLGIYEGFTLFKMNRVTVIEFAGEKEVAALLLDQVPILGKGKVGPDSGKTSRITSGIETIAAFRISKNALPFAKLRIRAMGVSAIRLFASFTPVDPKARVQIVRAPLEIVTSPENPCHRVFYVYGKWPKNLRKNYRYE